MSSKPFSTLQQTGWPLHLVQPAEPGTRTHSQHKTSDAPAVLRAMPETNSSHLGLAIHCGIATFMGSDEKQAFLEHSLTCCR